MQLLEKLLDTFTTAQLLAVNLAINEGDFETATALIEKFRIENQGHA
jgi:hypothetical protein